MTLNVSIGIYGPAEMVLAGDIYDELMVYYSVSQPRGRDPTWGRLAIFMGSRDCPPTF